MDKEKLYDVIVIGGGPAGLTAALYLARACYRVLVIEKEAFGGQITITSEVVNYPGVLSTTGKDLPETMRKQAQNFGAEFLLAEATWLDLDNDIKTVRTSKGDFSCFGVLIATGANPRTIGFPGESEFKGHGVAYCATCDGEFFRDKEIFVIGGGFAAAEEAVFLTKYGSHVTVLVRRDDFSCARSTADAVYSNDKITVLTNTEVEAVEGDNAIRLIRYKNNKTGQVTEFTPENNGTFGVFVFAGYTPATGLFKDMVELDPHGYVITDRNQKTNVDGVYAAGDVCIKNLRQVVTAVSDGAIAATELEKYAASMQEKTGIVPKKPVPASDDEHASLSASSSENGLSEEILSQLNDVFSRMESRITLRLYPDERPVSEELKEYMTAISSHTDKIDLEVIEEHNEPDASLVRVCTENGSDSGLAFHGVPGGHEFTSFIIGLYNAAGPGQALDEDSLRKIDEINDPTDIKVLVSLSCTMCPELVMAAQHIAALNDKVRAEVYDINHFPELKEKYDVMSVPCLVLNDSKVIFGKKNVPQLLEFLSE